MRNGSGDEAAHRLAVTWFKALVEVCYVPDNPADVLPVIHGCVVELRDELVSPRFSTEPGTRCAERLVQSHFASVEALKRSLDLLDSEMPTLARTRRVAVNDLAERWSHLRNAFTAGYVAAYIESVRKQKDDVWAALLEAYRNRG